MQEAGLKVKLGKPIVIFTETISHDYKGPAIMGKSPNKHNKLWITIDKLSNEVIEAIKSEKITDMQSRDERTKVLRSLGWSPDEAKGAVAVEENCILCNRIRGRQYVEEIIDHIKTGFREAVPHIPTCQRTSIRLKNQLRRHNPPRGPSSQEAPHKLFQ